MVHDGFQQGSLVRLVILARQLDDAAVQLKRSRAQVVRQALEYYLADLEDLRLGLERLRDPADPILDWADVRGELLNQD